MAISIFGFLEKRVKKGVFWTLKKTENKESSDTLGNGKEPYLSSIG